jgi:hypothetical protein
LSGEEALRDRGILFNASVKEIDYSTTFTSSGMEELDGVNQLASKPIGESDLFPRYREPELGDSSLSVVLDIFGTKLLRNSVSYSFTSLSRENSYWKKGTGGEAISSEMREEGSGKEYASSRGLGIKFSLGKNQECSKKIGG